MSEVLIKYLIIRSSAMTTKKLHIFSEPERHCASTYTEESTGSSMSSFHLALHYGVGQTFSFNNMEQASGFKIRSFFIDQSPI